MQASAQIVQVGSRAALGSDLVVNWQQFGKDGGFLSTPVMRRFGPQQVSVSSSSGQLLLKREGTTWHGDFVPGQYLLDQPYQSDSFSVSFNPPVKAVGTQIDPGSSTGFSGNFAGLLTFYGMTGNMLGSVQIMSTADAKQTGHAAFIGARSLSAPIRYVTLQVSGVSPNFTIEGDLAINQMDVVTGGP